MNVPTAAQCIKTLRGYGIVQSGGSYELWRLGKHGYLAGNVWDPANIAEAVDAAEEEMASLLAEAREEFG